MPEDIKVLVTNRAESPTKDTILATPGPEQSNVEVVTMTWWQIVLVRVARTYLQALIGFLGYSMVSDSFDAVAAQVFGNKFIAAAGFSLAPAVMSLLHNAAELLAQLDTKAPKIRG